MIENIYNRDELKKFSFVQKKASVEKSISKKELTDYLDKGWSVKKEDKTKIRIAKSKEKHKLLESRVWMVCYKMGFIYLSGEGGGQLVLNHKDQNSPKSQLDIVAIDDKVALCVECKSAQNPS